MDWLSEIEARANAATPGPWRYRGKSGSFHAPPDPGDSYEFGEYLFQLHDCAEPTILDGDLEFMIHAREDIPRLIGYVRRLEAELLRVR